MSTVSSNLTSQQSSGDGASRSERLKQLVEELQKQLDQEQRELKLTRRIIRTRKERNPLFRVLR